MSRHFSAEEIQDYVLNDRGTVVRVEEGESRRWQKSMYTTFQTEEGNFYIAYWQEGLTENQDDDFDAQTLEEVFPLSQVSASVNTVYSENPSANTHFLLNKEDLEASTFISDDAEAGLKAIKGFDTSTVLDFLKQADATILGDTDRAFLEASRQFFTAVGNIQKDL